MIVCFSDLGGIYDHQCLKVSFHNQFSLQNLLFITVGNEYPPWTSLNTYLRKERISVGTKVMCREGGCGICIVQAKLYEMISDSKKSYPINSVSIIGVEDSLSIISVENLLRIIDVENSISIICFIHPQKNVHSYFGI